MNAWLRPYKGDRFPNDAMYKIQFVADAAVRFAASELTATSESCVCRAESLWLALCVMNNKDKKDAVDCENKAIQRQIDGE